MTFKREITLLYFKTDKSNHSFDQRHNSIKHHMIMISSV